MNKTEIIASMAEKAGLTKVDAGKALDAFVATVKEEMAKDGSVSLIGFGTFSVSKRPARMGHNPRTNEKIKIAATKNVKFKASKTIL